MAACSLLDHDSVPGLGGARRSDLSKPGKAYDIRTFGSTTDIDGRFGTVGGSDGGCGTSSLGTVIDRSRAGPTRPKEFVDAVKGDGMPGITEADFEHWRQHGYVIVELLTPDEVAAAVDNINEYLPTWEEYVRRPRWFQQTIASAVRGPGQSAEFPYTGTAINKTTIHPDYVAFAERVMRTDRLMLSHGQLGGKYAGTRDFEQELHRDYGNNTLVVPPPDSEIVDLPMIVYYTDVTVDLSPTYVVSQEFTRDLPLTPRNLSRERYPEYYAQEVPVTVPAGSAVIYSMNTFHRGSAIRASAGLRYAQNVGLKRMDAPWSGQVTFQHEGGRPEMDAFLENASPRERELVGFPRVGDPYWDKVTLDGVEGRYPGMDMTPYRDAS